MKIKIESVKKLCMDVLVNLGLSRQYAEIILNEYLYGELAGKKSHGLASFPKIAEKVKGNKSRWEIVKEDDTYALIDGKGNLGQLVGRFAMDLAIKKAKAKGVSLVGMNNMESYLMPGYYARMASSKNMIGIVIDNSRSRVVPYGGIEPRIGTNPIGLAIPTKNIPFVLDMATAVRGMGEVRIAKKLGELLPEGMALDKEGNATRNPEEVNALVPMGAYKGYGLCLAIEILAGSLVRAKMGKKIKEGIDRGYLFIVINPEVFVDIKTFQNEVSGLIKEVKSSKKAKGVKEILIPGERAARSMDQGLKKGYIEVEDKIIEDIKKLS